MLGCFERWTGGWQEGQRGEFAGELDLVFLSVSVALALSALLVTHGGRVGRGWAEAVVGGAQLNSYLGGTGAGGGAIGNRLRSTPRALAGRRRMALCVLKAGRGRRGLRLDDTQGLNRLSPAGSRVRVGVAERAALLMLRLLLVLVLLVLLRPAM